MEKAKLDYESYKEIKDRGLKVNLIFLVHVMLFFLAFIAIIIGLIALITLNFIYLIPVLIFLISFYCLEKYYLIKAIEGLITNSEIFCAHTYVSVNSGEKYLKSFNKKDLKKCLKELQKGIDTLNQSVRSYGSFAFGSKSTQEELKKLTEILTNLRYVKNALKESSKKENFEEFEKLINQLDSLNQYIYQQDVEKAYKASLEQKALSKEILGDKIYSRHKRILNYISRKYESRPEIVSYLILLILVGGSFIAMKLLFNRPDYETLVTSIALIGLIKILMDLKKDLEKGLRERSNVD